MARASNDTTPTPANLPPRCRATLGYGLLGALLCYLAHPPAALGWLAWIGPVPWLLLARTERLPGRRPYLALWLAGWAFWLAAIQWLRLAHPANYFGGTLIAGYLGLYLPTFVALTRVAVHRLRVPLWLAGAVAWTGLEWLRARLLTGFLMASLAHTQVKFPLVIQIADLAGEYAVTFLIMLVAGAIASVLPLRWVDRSLPREPSEPGRPRPRRILLTILRLSPAAIAVLAAIAYSISARAIYLSIERPSPSPRLAIIQTNMFADWKGSPDRDADAMREQIDQTLRAVRGLPQPVDLVLWPETMFRVPWIVRDPQNPPADGAIHESRYRAALTELRGLARDAGAALLVGIDRVLVSQAAAPAEPDDVDGVARNAAVAVDRDGALIGYYAKNHLLPFGEYMPFVTWLPFLKNFTPITGAALEGTGHVAFKIDGVVYAPNICYESVLPQLVRQQVVELTAAGASPDVLVNLTNDAWFWGSSELDMHLASSVFRAVEMRRPMVIAANRGLSACINEWGDVLAVTERDRADALVVDVPLTYGRLTPYARYGDWLPLGCLGFCAVAATIGLADRRLRRHSDAT